MINLKRNTFSAWLKNRVRKDQFSGLPLSILLLICGYISLNLAGLTEDVVTSDWIVNLDYRIANYFEIRRTHTLVEFFLVFTFLGQALMVAWGFILTVIGLFWTRFTIWISPLIVSVATSVLLVYVGKDVIARPRPEDSLFPMHSFSFPSGHSTIAVSLYGFVGLMFILESKKKFNRAIFFVATIVIVSLILLSRMYLGVHYLSDVIGGLLVGGLSATLGFGVYLWQKMRDKNTAMVTQQQGWKVIILGILFCLAWIGYEAFGEYNLYQDQLKYMSS